eukprot:SAG22_NODE_3676_length_1582_cov_2.064734_2_plen_212_part_00
MRQKEYEAIVPQLTSMQAVSALAGGGGGGGASYNTLVSIYSQLVTQQMKSREREVRELKDGLLARYRAGTPLLAIAQELEYAPCKLARLLLEGLLVLDNRKQLTALLRCPSLIPCPRLAAEVADCAEADHQYSPRAELIKKAFGQEYEHRLNELLANAGDAAVSRAAPCRAVPCPRGRPTPASVPRHPWAAALALRTASCCRAPILQAALF